MQDGEDRYYRGLIGSLVMIRRDNGVRFVGKLLPYKRGAESFRLFCSADGKVRRFRWAVVSSFQSLEEAQRDAETAALVRRAMP